MPSKFIESLESQGYEVTTKKLGGGFVNDVRLVSAHKDGELFEYVLKTYKSGKDKEDMLRGYDALSKAVKTPTIVFREENEIAYDLVKGKSIKDLIIDGSPDAPEAVRLLAKELEKLHKSKLYKARFSHGDSPDERKMLRHIAKSLENEQLDERDANLLVKRIREYVPDNKSIVHGDAHLGNFLYSNGEVVFIDPDNVKISDYNADLGKVINAISELSDQGKLSASQAEELNELFLAEYQGEDSEAVNLFRARTPLIVLKNRSVDKTRKSISQVTKSLEARLASAMAVIVIAGFLVKNNYSGLAFGAVESSSKTQYLIPLAFIVTFAIILAAYLFFKKGKSFSKPRHRRL